MKNIIKIFALLLCFICFNKAQAQKSFVVGGNYKVLPVKLPDANPEKNSPIFASQLSADAMAIASEALPAGKVTIELTFMETEYTKAEQRGIAIFVNGLMLTANLDVFKEAGGAFRPLVKKYVYDFEGGRININLNGIGVNAILNAAKLYDATGKVIASGEAGTMKKDRILLKDNRSRNFAEVHPGDVPFYNVDHSPLGAFSSFIYGMEASGGIQMSSYRTGGSDGIISHKGVLLAVKSSDGIRVMPFCSQSQPLQKGSAYISAKEVQHTLSAGTDAWQIGSGVSWKHYMPYWPLKEIDKASEQEIAKFVLPATWMVFDVDNSKGSGELQVLLGLQNSKAEIKDWGKYRGYIIDQYSALAIKKEDAELINSEDVKTQFGLQEATSSFVMKVPKGVKKKITVIVAHYRSGTFSEIGGELLSFYFTKYYKSIDDVVSTAANTSNEAITACQKLDAVFNKSPENAERKFQIAHSLQSYRCNTVFYQTEVTHKPIWTVLEGEYGYINTFDLTVDHVFHELAMHPWTVRNELDMFDKYYSFTDEVRYGDGTKRYPGGIGFAHDMGNNLGFKTGKASYSSPMTQEELQNWILCAGLYYKKTNDISWLKSKRSLLIKCLQSMQIRDDIDSTKRDGITSMVSCIGEKDHDITTYDAMDKSLQQVNNSMYISVKSFASYLLMQVMFDQLGEKVLAETCGKTARLTAKSIVSYWDPKQQCFPAVFNDPSIDSKIMPAIEGLIFPYIMGLRKEVSLTGPNKDLISKLKIHMESIMKPGICINNTGGFLLSSTSNTSWQSKVFLEQYIMENILGVKMPKETARADMAQFAYQVLGAPAVCWSDQIRSKNITAYGGRHYPRGVTSALWWLYAK